MDSFGEVRRLAREKHDAMKVRLSGDATATKLLAQARAETKIHVQSLSSEHPLLAGGDGALRREGQSPSIYIASGLDPDYASFVEAHEFGHFWIETPTDPAITPRGTDPSTPEENTPLGLRRVEAYSSDELRERYANVFAREFLLPCPEAKRLFGLGHSAQKIATDLGLPVGLVNQQLAVALLLPEVSTKEKPAKGDLPGLDASQQKAAEYEGSPLLVEAGPGTGKTRTLIARIEYLLNKGVPPSSILVLTFSNKAAQEIRERVAATAPNAAPEVWAGTFHAFGLELLRKYGDLVGIAQPVVLRDQPDQLALLERELPQLGLDHYLRLHEPLLELRNILGAISRAKDEVFSPKEYAHAAERMRVQAGGDQEKIVKAEKASEVAKVYKHYDECLRNDGSVDFADLIGRSIEILRDYPEARDELRGQYGYILVDEYQDVNRASALMLKELAGDGKRLWVVGDARQSIYRFRGAAPSNTTAFEKDYPTGKRLPLTVNYRSVKQVVDTFTTYANNMKVGRGRDNTLHAKRGSGVNPVDFNVATDLPSEIGGIAAAIRYQHAAGQTYRAQAVLCRSHSNLQKIATGLEAAGIPVLYLGDLFERPEVRDLLSLLSFTSERHRGGLMRLACLPRWKMPLKDVRTFLAHASTTEKTPLSALSDIETIEGISSAGRTALQKLRTDLSGIGFMTSPGQFLCDVLFERGLIRDYLSGATAADHQRRLAIHQFLQFAIEYRQAGDGDPKRRLLNWVRRLELFGDERALREPPAAVEGIDAVRLMTVHASKGLEFKTVHLPGLGNGIFPFTGGWRSCPPPDGMLSTTPDDDRKDEEECLFFVALSRARDNLSLSRAQRYSKARRSLHSPALEVIASHLPNAPGSAPTWTTPIDTPIANSDRPDLKQAAREHDAHDLERYLKCPRSYLYQTILGLSASREDNGYIKLHRVLYRVLGWMAEQTGAVTAEALHAEIEARWAESGPTDHPLQPLYRTSAKKILDQANGRPRDGIKFAQEMIAHIDGHTINLTIDEIEQAAAGFVIRRLRTGKSPSNPDHCVVHALMLEAAKQAHGPTGRFEIRYLSSDEIKPISFDRVMADRLEATKSALASLSAGGYPAIPSEDCPRCPHYFICQEVPG